MHEHLGSFTTHPKKFHQNFINFKKPKKILQKPKNLGLMHEMHEE